MLDISVREAPDKFSEGDWKVRKNEDIVSGCDSRAYVNQNSCELVFFVEPNFVVAALRLRLWA